MRRLLLAAALGAAVLAAPPASATPASSCVRTPGSVYWEACVDRNGCLVYLWASKPPYVCLGAIS